MPEETIQVPIDLSIVFELLSNKKNDILNIDYSNDDDSYPTVRAVKNYVDNVMPAVSDMISGKENISNKVTSWNSTPSDDNYPSEKLVKDSLDNLNSNVNTGMTNLNSNVNTAISTVNNRISNLNTSNILSSGESLNNIGSYNGTVPQSTINSGINTQLGTINTKISSVESSVETSKHILEATRSLDGSRVNLTINLSYLTTITDPSVDFSPLYVKLPNNMASTTGGVRFIIKYNNGNSTFPTQQLYDMNGSSGIRENVLSANEIIIIGWDSNKLKLLKILGKEYSTVAETGSYNDLSDQPTIPTASISTPSADTTNGSIGDGTTWARSNHTHPKSSLYAETSHTHGNITNDGKIGTSNNSNKNVVTDANGNITIEDKELGGIELIETTNTSDNELTATSTTLSEVKEGTMILLKVINPFTALPADCRLTLTLKNGDVLDRKLIKHPDSSTYLRSNIVPPNTIFLMRYTNGLWHIIDQYNLATQSFRGFMSAEDKTKLDSITPNANQVNIDTSLSETSTNPVQNKAIKEALDTHTHASLQKTTITSGNLNNYTDTGWYSYSTANSSSITNTPENVGSVMEVFDEYGDGSFVVQKVYTLPSDNKSLIYYRNKYNTSWGEWIKTDGRDKIGKGIIDGGVNLLTPNRPTPSGTADGTMVENGTLYGEPVYELDLSSTSDTTKYNDFYFVVTPDNFTKGDIFTLSFWAKGNNGDTLKTYFAGTSGYVNVKRLRSNSTFTGNAAEGTFGDGSTTYNLTTDWQHYYVTYQLNTRGDDTLNKSIHLRVFGGNKISVSRIKLERGEVATDYSSRYNQTTKVPKGANLNDYIRGGFYYNDHDTESANISNLAETGKAFFLLVEDWEESNYTKQTITHHGTRKTYTRIRSAGVWTSWSQLALKSEVYTKAEIDTLIGNIEEDMLS